MAEEAQARPEEQEERREMCCCPICGGMHYMPRGPVRMRRMMHWGMMPWGGPWGRGWGMGMGVLCAGPTLLAFGLGLLLGRRG